MNFPFAVDLRETGIEPIRVYRIAESEDGRGVMIWLFGGLAERMEALAKRQGVGVEELILKVLKRYLGEEW